MIKVIVGVFLGDGRRYHAISFNGKPPPKRQSDDRYLRGHPFNLPPKKTGFFGWGNVVHYNRALDAWIVFFQGLNTADPEGRKFEQLLLGFFEAGLRASALSIPETFHDYGELAPRLEELYRMNQIVWREIANCFYSAGHNVDGD